MLPFFIDNLFRTDIEGTALPQREGLKLVFHSPKDGEHLFDADVEEVMIPWSGLDAIDITRGFLKSKLILVVHSSSVFPRQLKLKDGKLQLTIRRRDKESLDRFEKDLAELRSGKANDDTDEFVDDMRDFLDRM